MVQSSLFVILPTDFTEIDYKTNNFFVACCEDWTGQLVICRAFFYISTEKTTVKLVR